MNDPIHETNDEAETQPGELDAIQQEHRDFWREDAFKARVEGLLQDIRDGVAPWVPPTGPPSRPTHAPPRVGWSHGTWSSSWRSTWPAW